VTWLIACECSGRIRDAMIARGIDAVSCDLKPSEQPGPHIQGDATEQLRRRWAGVIAHPDCTYLANSGVRWLHSDPLRWPRLFAAADFFRACLNANAPKVAVENPVMHKYALRLVGIGPSFSVQPWQFGDNFKKRTCFWTVGLRALVPTSDLDGNTASDYCFRLPPGPERKANRSRTYPGIAAAIADQWALRRDLVDLMVAA